MYATNGAHLNPMHDTSEEVVGPPSRQTSLPNETQRATVTIKRRSAVLSDSRAIDVSSESPKKRAKTANIPKPLKISIPNKNIRHDAARHGSTIGATHPRTISSPVGTPTREEWKSCKSRAHTYPIHKRFHDTIHARDRELVTIPTSPANSHGCRELEDMLARTPRRCRSLTNVSTPEHIPVRADSGPVLWPEDYNSALLADCDPISPLPEVSHHDKDIRRRSSDTESIASPAMSDKENIPPTEAPYHATSRQSFDLGWIPSPALSDKENIPPLRTLDTPLTADPIRSKGHSWNPEHYVDTPLHSAPLLQGFGPLPQGLGPAARAEQERCWRHHRLKIHWWQAPDGAWWTIPEITMEWKEVDRSGLSR